MSPNPIIQPDAADVLATRNIVKSGRGEPKLLEWSMMDVTCKAQHGWGLASGTSVTMGGTITRTANSRFRVSHGLSSTPQEVVVMRLNTDLGSDAGGGASASETHEQSAIPDTSSYNGYNVCKAHDTTAYGLICVNTTSPIADSRYSYFTVGFPIGLWAMVATNSDAGAGQCMLEIPEYCGRAISGTAQWWRGDPAGTGSSEISVRIGNAAYGSVPVPGVGGPFQYGPPIDPGRTFTASNNAIPLSGAKMPLLVNAFLGISDKGQVTVRVISRLWDAPTRRGIFVSPSADAHPAP